MNATISLSIQEKPQLRSKQPCSEVHRPRKGMRILWLCSSSSFTCPASLLHPRLIANTAKEIGKQQRGKNFALHAAKSGGFPLKSITNRCQTCKGRGAIECPGCKGTGKNKKNGNIFERWKCFECLGFGLKSCPVCGKGGLTPEQRGER